MMLTFEQAKYDHYVTSGGGDVCFAYGMSGHCGPECPEFGHRDGCAGLNDNMKDGDTNG